MDARNSHRPLVPLGSHVPVSGVHDQGEAPRLALLRFLERVQLADLDRTRRWIAEEERREVERQQGEATQPTPPDWLLDCGLNRGAIPVGVHIGACHMVGARAKGADSGTARRALAAGVPECGHCRPDSELGILD
ncbi:DUF6233 domain-containing protein [Streptomyces monashensis]|uniref:DUF6233 domain-containing protein n=1 Tax=Streptomyces monashensis TaxID=1678012 RepID=UPI003F541628